MCFLCLLCSFLATDCRRSVEQRVTADPEPGVPLTLANQRAQSIDALSYDLAFTIPAAPSEPIEGHAIIRFAAKDLTKPLVLDFSPGMESLKSVSVGGRPSHFRLIKDHIIIPKEELASEDNVLEIGFRAGDAALNRDYTLVMGTVVVIAIFTILFNLLVDILYAVVDPRVRYD